MSDKHYLSAGNAIPSSAKMAPQQLSNMVGSNAIVVKRPRLDDIVSDHPFWRVEHMPIAEDNGFA
jgi:hypothetical protein